MTTNPSAGQPRRQGKFDFRANAEADEPLTPEDPFLSMALSGLLVHADHTPEGPNSEALLAALEGLREAGVTGTVKPGALTVDSRTGDLHAFLRISHDSTAVRAEFHQMNGVNRFVFLSANDRKSWAYSPETVDRAFYEAHAESRLHEHHNTYQTGELSVYNGPDDARFAPMHTELIERLGAAGVRGNLGFDTGTASVQPGGETFGEMTAVLRDRDTGTRIDIAVEHVNFSPLRYVISSDHLRKTAIVPRFPDLTDKTRTSTDAEVLYATVADARGRVG